MHLSHANAARRNFGDDAHHGVHKNQRERVVGLQFPFQNVLSTLSKARVARENALTRVGSSLPKTCAISGPHFSLMSCITRRRLAEDTRSSSAESVGHV